MSHPKRILHVFSRMDRGGAELRILDVLRSLDREQFSFHFCVLSDSPGHLDEEIASLGGTIHRCPLGPSFLRHFETMIRLVRPEVVHSHVHYLSGIMIRQAAKAGVPVRIVHFRSTNDGRINSPRRFLQRLVMRRWIDRYATHILAVSNGAMREAWLKYRPNDPRCETVYNGFNTTSILSEQNVRRDDPIDPRILSAEMVCIHVGRLIEAKNQVRLVGIFHEIRQRVPEAVLLLVGEGDSAVKAEVRRQVHRLDLEDAVHLLGLRTDVSRLLAIADIMVFPSLREGLPGAVIESCAVGTPVLASDLPGTREIGQYFGQLCALKPLAASDGEWASSAVEIARSSPMNSAEAASLFRASPFAIQQCVDKLSAIWLSSRYRDTVRTHP